MLIERGSLALRDVAGPLNVSEATVRRDINRLAADGRVRRVYGGASIREPDEIPFVYSDVTDRDQKRRIADTACRYVTDGDTVILDVGSTVLEIARRLAGRDITVVTSNLAVCDVFRGDAATELVVLGGTVRHNYQSTVGAITESALSHIHADVAFFGTSGVTTSGKMLDTIEAEATIRRRMLVASERHILLASERKFPGTGRHVVCPASDIQVLVTTCQTPTAYLEPFRNANTEIVQV